MPTRTWCCIGTEADHLIVSDDNQLKVLDFVLHADGGAVRARPILTEHASFTPRLCRSGTDTQSTDQGTRTDVYGLGLVMFELLGDGSSPFGESATELTESKLADRRSRLWPGRPDLNPRQIEVMCRPF